MKLQFLENDNPLRDSSAGVQFFSASTLSAHCFFIHEIIISSIIQYAFELHMHECMYSCFHVFHSDKYVNLQGFVEDLVVEDDPKSSWQDYFRKANKSSNDSRLKVLYNLSAEVRRELGKKVIEAGGNAVLAYSVQFDIEGASGIVGEGCLRSSTSGSNVDMCLLMNRSAREWNSVPLVESRRRLEDRQSEIPEHVDE